MLRTVSIAVSFELAFYFACINSFQVVVFVVGAVAVVVVKMVDMITDT